MNTATTSLGLDPRPSTDHDAGSGHRLTLARVLRSEWIKFRSVRSTLITLGFTGVAVAAFGILVSMLSNGSGVGADGPALRPDPAGNSLFGTNIAQLVLGVLGALLVTSEYSTGQIRSTLTTVPKRLPVLWAKAIVVGLATFATMTVGVGVAFFAGQVLYDGAGPGASLFDPGVMRAVLGAAVFPTAIAVMGIALGVLMRHTATAVGVLFGMLFIVPILLQSLGGFWSDIAAYLPSEAGQAMTTIITDADRLSPLAGFAVIAAWVGALLAAAAFTLDRRDA
jgi:hypothetical protein